VNRQSRHEAFSVDDVKPIAAVLFDFYDTLFWKDGATRVMAVGELAGLALDPIEVATISSQVVALSITPDETGKGRDLSMQAHRECWTNLYRPFDRLAPELQPPLSVRIYNDAAGGSAHLPFPDTVRCLDALGAMGVPMGVVSDIGWDVRQPFVKHDIAGRFKVFVPSFAHGCEKPDRRLFQAACDVLGVELDEVLMVGDNAERDGGAVRHGLRAYIMPPWSGTGDRGLMAVPAIVQASRL
jgi:FMN phosphatase YigB (HAD superfamily)